MHSISTNCPCCRRPLPRRATFGLCPACLLSRAKEDEEGEALEGGLLFGGYEILEEIARGGMGTVFKARQQKLNRLVALKVVSGGALASRELVERFRNEAEAAARLSHPNIVPIYEVGEHEGQPFFSMEFIEGGTLAQHLAEGKRGRGEKESVKPLDVHISSAALPPGSFSERRAAELVIALAHAVHFAHQRGILHRDIKPANILLDAQGEPHLTDFGLARVLEKESTLTHTMALLGTPSYMSPEQARGGTKQLTTAADVYALGAVLYELLAGAPPFAGGTTMETVRLVLDTEPRRPCALNPALDRDLETICLKCLEKEPAQRYVSALALAEDLERWLRHEPILARPSTLLERSAKWVHRRPVVAALTFGLGAALLLGFAATLWQWRRAEGQTRTAHGAQSRAEQLVDRLDLERADARLATGERAEALALFASVLRRDPSNQIAAERLLSFLSDHTFALPMSEGLAPETDALKLFPSPDGRWLLTSSASGAVQIWSTANGQLERTLARVSSPASGAGWSRDGRFVAAGFYDKTARVWEAATGREASPPLLHPFVPVIDFSRDGEHLITYGWLSRSLRIWKWRTGQLVKEISGLPPLRGMRPHPAANSVYLAYADGIEVRDFEGQRLAAVRRDDYPNVGASTPDGRVIAMTTGLKGVVFLDGTTLQPLPFGISEDIPEGRPTFDVDGLWLVMGERLRVGELRDLRTGRAVNVPLLHRDSGRLAWLLADGERLLTSGDGQWAARICDVRPGRVLSPPLRHTRRITSAVFSPDGTRVLTTSLDRTARIWDTSSGQPVTAPLPHGSPVNGGFFTADGKRVATLARDNAVRVWDSITGELLRELRHDTTVHDAAFSPDGSTLLAATDEAAWVWDLSREGSAVRRLAHNSPVRDVAFSPRGTQFATGTAAGESELLDRRARVSIWPMGAGKPATAMALPSGVSSLAFAPDGGALAVASSDGAVGVWNMASNTWRFRLLRHEEGIPCVRFSPDGKWIVTAGRDEVVQILSAVTGESRYDPLPHGETVLHAEFCGDGKRFLTLTASGILRVWDTESGLPLTEPLRDVPAPVLGWTPPNSATLFSPDSQRVLAIASDFSARVVGIPIAPEPAPLWLAELTEAIAGQRLTAARQTEQITWEDYLELRNRLASLPGQDFYSRWGRWFFADRNARTISPWSEQTVSDYGKRRLEENTLDSLFEAVRLQPTNAVVLARLGAALSRQKPPGLLEFTGSSALLIRRALQLAPDNPEVQAIARTISPAGGR